jgi:hypothetical protein
MSEVNIEFLADLAPQALLGRLAGFEAPARQDQQGRPRVLTAKQHLALTYNQQSDLVEVGHH